MALDQHIIDRVAAAIESAEVGYSLILTRLVDGERTYTLTYSDGSPPLTFDDIDDGYLHIRERKRQAQALAVTTALAVPTSVEGSPLLDWAVSRWNAEVKNRPLVNVHRRSLDDTWRQVIRWAGGDPVQLCGPAHDDLLAAAITTSGTGGGE